MKKVSLILFSFILSSSLFSQHEIPCSDFKILLDDALAKHHDDKGALIGTNEYTQITEYKYHLTFPWAVSCSIKEMEFEDKKRKSWGEILCYEISNKDSAISYAEHVRKELKECFTHGVDKTDKAGTEGRDFSFVFMIHNQSSWTDIELFVNHTGEEYHVYIIF